MEWDEWESFLKREAPHSKKGGWLFAKYKTTSASWMHPNQKALAKLCVRALLVG
jgi:hypothetical protein